MRENRLVSNLSRGLAGEAGVTLTELVVVLIIIGLVSAFALPRLDIAQYQINGSMRGVGTSLIGTQRFAVTRQHDVIVTVDASKNLIRVLDDANNNGIEDTNERTRPIMLGEQVVIGRGSAPAHSIGTGPVVFNKKVGGLPAVTFHRNGSASEMGGLYLTSQRAIVQGGHAKDTRLILVDRATGRVEWHRYTGSAWERGF